MKSLLTPLFLLMVLVLASTPLLANIKMPGIFGDHMVLQQEMKLPVWGTADPGEEVTVTVGTETAKATAAADGSWRVDLPPFPDGSAPVTMTVTGKNTLTFGDVVIGEVWLCSGQSNMYFHLYEAHNAGTEIAAAQDPLLRQFTPTYKTVLDPQTDVTGQWVLCNPKTAGGFTAVGYFFGKELRKSLNRPIGLIGSNWGGTPAQAWTSIEALRKVPLLQHYVDVYDKLKADFPQAEADFLLKKTAFDADTAKWKEDIKPAYDPLLKDWSDAVVKAKAAGQAAPPRPPPPTPPPVAPVDPAGSKGTPAGLYNVMIAPIIPYGIKGAIWYQGEGNSNDVNVTGFEYETLFPTMITDWRQRWGEGDFPFIFVQLPDIKGRYWPVIRESQLKTLSLPNTGMAVTIDIGDPAWVHPADKLDVGLRLALIARHLAYGQDIVYSGPMYDSMKVEGSTLRLSFTQTGGGLAIGTPPWIKPGRVPTPTDKLLGFAIAGADKKWFAADAGIDGSTVVISSPDVPQPTAVRYAWANDPTCNFYNKDGLPASPFRTDDWDDVLKINDFPAPPTSPVPPKNP